MGVVFLVEGATASMVSRANRHVCSWGLINGVVPRVWSPRGYQFFFSGIDLLGFSASFQAVEGKRPVFSRRESMR